MPAYVYTATTEGGEERTGTYEAESKGALALVLRKQGLLLTSAEVAGAKGGQEGWKVVNEWFAKIQGVSEVERLLFTRHLGVMIRAGLPLTKAVATLARQTQNLRFRGILEKVEQGIRRGETFSSSLAKTPAVFDEFFVSMVEVGEAGGSLEKVLKILEYHIARIHEIKQKVMGALIYPAVIIGVMMLIGTVMMVMVVPKLTEVFEDLDVELPIATQFVIAISTALTDYAFVVLAVFVGFIFLARWFLKKPGIRDRAHDVILHIPIFGTLVRKMNVSRFARNLSSLMTSGVPILRALEIVSRTLGNINYRESVAEAGRGVQKGHTLHEILGHDENLYPLIVIQMIEVGEETGELSSILEQLAEFYEDEVTRATENMTAVIEPLLMVIIGGVVGFFAIAMIQPMYAMLGNL